MSGTRSIASAGGAIVAAIASSACCWLPLLLMTFGLSVGSVSAWFEQYRLIFLIVAGVLLSLGFYSAYFAGRRCDPACGCWPYRAPTAAVPRTGRVASWLVGSAGSWLGLQSAGLVSWFVARLAD